MSTIAELEAQRERVLKAMRSIRAMKRGTVSVRYEKVRHRGNPEPVLRGPYGLFVRQERGRSVGWRLHSEAEIAQAREEVAAYERFEGLCREFVELTERLGAQERSADASQEALKKGRKSRSSRRPK